VYNAPYLKGLVDDFGEIPGLIRFSSDQDLALKLRSNPKFDTDFRTYRYSSGVWDF
jgi:hypothetical protein